MGLVAVWFDDESLEWKGWLGWKMGECVPWVDGAVDDVQVDAAMGKRVAAERSESDSDRRSHVFRYLWGFARMS